MIGKMYGRIVADRVKCVYEPLLENLKRVCRPEFWTAGIGES